MLTSNFATLHASEWFGIAKLGTRDNGTRDNGTRSNVTRNNGSRDNAKCKNANTSHFKCSNDLCKIRCNSLGGNINLGVSQHNHPREDHKIEVLHFKNNLRTRAASQNDLDLSLLQIYEQESGNFPNAALQVSYLSFETTMRRCRARARPLIPENLQAYGQTLGSAEWNARFGRTASQPVGPFYRHCVQQDGTTSVIFASDRQLQLLRSARRLFIDATFRVTPNSPGSRQLLSIHAKHHGHVSIIAFNYVSFSVGKDKKAKNIDYRMKES
ncbi:hypothetical protein B566_EDAN001826 [Ephemera danica]|nr:hypothetical protein B566_EDAN001826 [Ephemera danica]